MKKYLIFGMLVFSLLFVTAKGVNAQSCGGQYQSPCQSYSILVDKMVQVPGTSNYVDNLSVSDPRYKPGQYVMFKVTIKNTSTTTFGGMTAKDYVPSYLTPVEGPGTFDPATRIITWDAGFFNVDESKTFYFKMQVNSQANLPADKGLFCITNRADATSNTTYDDDTAQLCIEKQVTPGATTPKAGPEMGLVLMAIQMAGVGAGIYLRKKA